jgi:hypothetical protein
LTEAEKYELTNGCGPARATSLVPNSILGVDIKPACDIHDFTYSKPQTVRDREEADFIFAYNMRRLIEQKLRPGFFRSFGFFGVGVYLLAVRLLGGKYFSKEQITYH